MHIERGLFLELFCASREHLNITKMTKTWCLLGGRSTLGSWSQKIVLNLVGVSWQDKCSYRQMQGFNHGLNIWLMAWPKAWHNPNGFWHSLCYAQYSCCLYSNLTHLLSSIACRWFRSSSSDLIYDQSLRLAFGFESLDLKPPDKLLHTASPHRASRWKTKKLRSQPVGQPAWPFLN